MAPKINGKRQELNEKLKKGRKTKKQWQNVDKNALQMGGKMQQQQQQQQQQKQPPGDVILKQVQQLSETIDSFFLPDN